jgi:hypothetical protein
VCVGDLLLSGAASSVLVWKERIQPEEWEDDRADHHDDDDDEGDEGGGGGGGRRPRIPEDQR